MNKITTLQGETDDKLKANGIMSISGTTFALLAFFGFMYLTRKK